MPIPFSVLVVANTLPSAQQMTIKWAGGVVMARVVLIAFITALLFGCASSHVMLGKARPPISPDAVKLYVRPPAKYEEVALLESSSKNSFAVTQQGKTNKAIQRLREEAAALGANGVLVQGTGDQYDGTINTGSATATTVGNSTYATGSGVGIPVFHKAASGVAIYVIEE